MTKFVPVLLLLCSITLFSQPIPIDSLRFNDSTGQAIKTGQLVTITGVVTASNQFGSNGPGAVQDDFAGVWIYGSSFSTPAIIGDSVVVTAQLTNYKGLAELDMTKPGSVFSKVSSGHTVTPRVITLSDVINQQWNGHEEFEGMLIRINNVTISSSGNFAAGTNYNITDSTGVISGGLRIAGTSNTIVGTPVPSQPIDIIGVLGQYKSGAPYNSGYQLQPRFINDLVSDSNPLILNPVTASDITLNSFTVYFNTARKGTSQVNYGLSASALNDSIVVNEDTTFHKIKIEGLTPATEYFYQAVSSNSAGVSRSNIQSVTTASNDTTTGTINVYFNYPVDTTVAIPGNKAKGNIDFRTKLLNRINNANYSIDMNVYSFDGLSDVANALVLAKNRGVKIRVAYDNRTTQASMQLLVNAGILISKRPSSLDGINHNKFFVFDSRDSIKTNDWIWTGSWNITSTELSWKNNALEINDYALAKAYQTEFEEMWGSNTDTPNPSLAKFGSQKSDNTPHEFNIKNRGIKLYFSPSDGTSAKITSTINTAQKSIYLALFVFTYNNIASAIRSRFDAGASDIKGVMHDTSGEGTEYPFLKSFADIMKNTGNTLHDKYAIVDAYMPDSDPAIITGSHNWSAAAENNNDENTLIINDIYIANQYMQDFKQRYNDAGGTGTFIVPVVGINDYKNPIENFSYKLFQNYPNPFNPVTTIRFELPYSMHVELTIYDMLGREVRTLFNGEAPGGVVAVDFNASGLSSGVYIYKVKADGFTASKKLILIK